MPSAQWWTVRKQLEEAVKPRRYGRTKAGAKTLIRGAQARGSEPAEARAKPDAAFSE
jgi:hypothetical protein